MRNQSTEVNLCESGHLQPIVLLMLSDLTRACAQALMNMGNLPTEAYTVAQMLHAKPDERPSLEQVLLHPCWWDDKHRLQFLVYVSDYLEVMGKVCCPL